MELKIRQTSPEKQLLTYNIDIYYSGNVVDTFKITLSVKIFDDGYKIFKSDEKIIRKYSLKTGVKMKDIMIIYSIKEQNDIRYFIPTSFVIYDSRIIGFLRKKRLKEFIKENPLV